MRRRTVLQSALAGATVLAAPRLGRAADQKVLKFIPQADLAVLRQAAAEALEWSDEDMDRLVTAGTLVEIEHGQDDDG